MKINNTKRQVSVIETYKNIKRVFGFAVAREYLENTKKHLKAINQK